MLDKNEHLYNALMTSLNDYCKKNNFSTALIGISGGIDSALTASIAADVLGSKNIKSFFYHQFIHLKKVELMLKICVKI